VQPCHHYTGRMASATRSVQTPGLFNEPAFTPRSASAPWVSAHCDGGSRGNPGPAGYGAVVRAEDGSLLAELGEFLGVCSNNVAEYSGLLGVLQWSLENAVTHLRVVSDSDLMVKQIQGKYAVKSPDLRPLWEESRRRIGRLQGFEISHALRHKNKDADRLANEAMDRGMGRTKPAPAPAKPAIPLPTNAAQPNAARANPYPAASSSGRMVRGFIRNGVVEMLGSDRLPDGLFVKIITE
jgi:ribonuclease HI